MINDFTFCDKGEYYIVTGGLATKMPNLYIDNLPDIYEDSKNVVNSDCLLFDFTTGLSESQIKDISNKHHITVKGIYNLTAHSDKKQIRLSDVIFGELQLLNIPFIYIVNDNNVIDKNDIWWAYKNRYNDKVIAYQV